MKIWRKKSTKYIDSETGKRTTKSNPKAVKQPYQSKRWYGTLTTCDGKRKQQPLTEERESSIALLKRLQHQHDHDRANGVTESTRQRRRPLARHIDEYREYLGYKGNTPSYVEMQINRIHKLLSSSNATTIDDLQSNTILKTLERWRTTGLKHGERKRLLISESTSNHYLKSIKSFTRWLWTEKRTNDDVCRNLRPLTVTILKRKRRPLTKSEIERLLSVTQSSLKTYRGDTWQFRGSDRAMLYRVALGTGLRASELASLTRSSFDLENGIVTIEAANTKNRKRSRLPLSSSLIPTLTEYLKSLRTDFVFGGIWAKHRNQIRFFRNDLKSAGIKYIDDRGRYADFHSLRHTFITSLAVAGVHPGVAQRLARHSTIRLTMDVYTDLQVDDLRAAINTL